MVATQGAPACVTGEGVAADRERAGARGASRCSPRRSKVTGPLPVPVAPAVTVIQAALLVAVHAQPVAAVTGTLAPVDAAAATLAVAGESVGAHGAPACVSVKVLPPIVSVARARVRGRRSR